MSNKSSKTIDKAQISAWKEQYHEVYYISIEGKKGYFRMPDRATIGYAMSQATNNPLGYYEALAQSTWLGGDNELLADDAYFLSICNRLSELIQIKEAELKKC